MRAKGHQISHEGVTSVLRAADRQRTKGWAKKGWLRWPPTVSTSAACRAQTVLGLIAKESGKT
jgi:hypothetical protein